MTDRNGQFDLITVKPGYYQGESSPPPAHIHLEVIHPDLQKWETEIVFLGDPYLSSPVQSGVVAIPLEETSTAEGQAYSGVAEIMVPIRAGDRSSTVTVQPIHTYEILSEESSASYQITEKFADIASMVSAIGVTHLIEGEVKLNQDLIPLPGGARAQVDLRNLRTDDPKRDENLANRWLVTNEFPFANFTSTTIEGFPAEVKAGENIQFTLKGDLTIRDTTRPVAFDVHAIWQEGMITGDAETQILMTDFGIDPPNLLGFVKVEDEVRLQIHLKAQEGGNRE